MVCIYCGSATRVTNSRQQRQTNHVWRRRKCSSCGAVFTSNESVDYPKSFVLEMLDKSLRPFKKEQLFVSVLKCCEHRTSAIDDAVALTETILNKMIRSSDQSVIAAHHLCALTHETLQRFDHASAVQYAALHPEYKL